MKLLNLFSRHVEMAMNHPQCSELLKKIEDNGFNVFNAVCQYSLFEMWENFTKIYYASKYNFFLETKGIVAKWSIIKDKMAV